MERTVIGYSRKKRNDPRLTEDLCYVLGLFAVAGMLLLPMRRTGPDFGEKEAVMVMSTAVVNESESPRDELAEPEKRAALTEDWSVFDGIGTFFADLIFGE